MWARTARSNGLVIPVRWTNRCVKFVAGQWDRAAFGKGFLAGQQAEIARMQLNEALHRRDFAKAIELIDKRLTMAEERKNNSNCG